MSDFKQYIFITNNGFQAVVTKGADIDCLKVIDYALENSSNSLLGEFEEFIYRNPELLEPDRSTYVLFQDNNPQILTPGDIQEASLQHLIQEAWDKSVDDDQDITLKWIEIKMDPSWDVNSHIAIDCSLYNFIRRSFHPLEISCPVNILLREWSDSIKLKADERYRIFIHTDSSHFYFGLFDKTGKIIALPAYNISPELSYLFYFFNETLRLLVGEEKTEIKVLISEKIHDKEALVSMLEKAGYDVQVKPSVPKLAFLSYISDRKDIDPKVALYISQTVGF